MQKKIYRSTLFATWSVAAFLWSGCQVSTTSTEEASATNAPETSTPFQNDHLTMGVLWIQRAAEVRALHYQGYQIAEKSLQEILANHSGEKKPAVVVDIDETVLDNSPYQAKMVIEDFDYPIQWREWIARADARAIPGAIDFLTKATEWGVDVFYISNRKVEELEDTIKNLNAHGFPQVRASQIYLRTNTNEKKERRAEVLKTHDILLLVGDNLGDFADFFEEQSETSRAQLVDENRALFGSKFIMLPNPMYGQWESAFPRSAMEVPPSQRQEGLESLLKGF